MTQAQWLFEYWALREKEKTEVDFELTKFKGLRKLLVSLLGLDLMSEGEEDGMVIPLSLMVARPDVLELLNKHYQENSVSEHHTQDEEFEALSKAIADGEDLGDMEPLIENKDVDEYQKNWFNAGRLEELRRTGVKVTFDPPPPESSKPVDQEDIQKKLKEQRKSRREQVDLVEKELDKEFAELRNRGVNVKIEDDG